MTSTRCKDICKKSNVANLLLTLFAVLKIAMGVGNTVRFLLYTDYYHAASWSIVLACVNICFFSTLVIYQYNKFQHKYIILTRLVVLVILIQIICFLATIIYTVFAINRYENNKKEESHSLFWAALMSLLCWLSSLFFTIRSIHFRRSILNTRFDQEHGHVSSDSLSDQNAQDEDDDDEIISVGSPLNQDSEARGLIIS